MATHFIKNSVWVIERPMALGSGLVPMGTTFRVEYPRRGQEGGIPVKFQDFDVMPLIKKVNGGGSVMSWPEGKDINGRYQYHPYQYDVRDYRKSNRFPKADLIMNEDKLRNHSRCIDIGPENEYLLFNKATGKFWRDSLADDRTYVSVDNALMGVIKNLTHKNGKLTAHPSDWKIVKRNVFGKIEEALPLFPNFIDAVSRITCLLAHNNEVVKIVFQLTKHLRSIEDKMMCVVMIDAKPSNKNWVKQNLPNTTLVMNERFYLSHQILLGFKDEEEIILGKLKFSPDFHILMDFTVID